MADETRVYILVVNDLEREDQKLLPLLLEKKRKRKKKKKEKARKRESTSWVAHVPSNTDTTSFSVVIDEPLISLKSRSLHATLPFQPITYCHHIARVSHAPTLLLPSSHTSLLNSSQLFFHIIFFSLFVIRFTSKNFLLNSETKQRFHIIKFTFNKLYT